MRSSAGVLPGCLTAYNMARRTPLAMLSRSSLKLKFGWTWRFLFVWILQMYLKSRAHLFRRPDDYRAHQKDFFKLRILEDGSDKSHAVRRRIASYAHDSAAIARSMSRPVMASRRWRSNRWECDW